MKIYGKKIRLLLMVLLISSGAMAQHTGTTGQIVLSDTVSQKRQETAQKRWKNIFMNRSMFFFDRALMGNTLGVYTANGGYPGNAGNLLLRGVTSANLNATPFIIIDGLPVRQARNLSPFASGIYPSNIGFINPLDIANIRVLTDGYEGSFYGGKASNGIIEVEIDKGAIGSATIDAILRVGLAQADHSLDMMGPAEYRPYLYSMMMSKGISEADLQGNILFDQNHPKYNHNTDWMDIFRRDAMFKDFQLKMKGGDGDTRYLFSLGYTSDEETIKPAVDNRFNMRFNLDYRITPKIRISNFFSYNYETSRFYGEGTAWDQNPVYLAATKAPFMSSTQYTDGGIRIDRLADADVLGKSNPAVFENNLKNQGIGNRVDALIKAVWNITPKISVNTDLAVSYNAMIEKLHQKAQGIVPDRYIKRQNSKRNYSEYLVRWNLWLGKDGKLSDNITFGSRLGMTVESYQEKMIYGRKVNAATDEIVTVSGGGTADSIANNRYQHNLMNFYLTGHLMFGHLLRVAANVNTERSSNFGPSGSWNLYAGASTDLYLVKTQENTISLYGKWGRTGNHDLRGAYYAKMYKPTKYYYYGGVYLGNVSNDDLKPEITDNYDIGIRTSLFNNFLDISAGYYLRKTTGLLTRKNLPIEIGLDPQFENNGDVFNKGVELGITANILHGENVEWSIFANVSTLENEVKNLKNGDIVRVVDKYTGVAREGEALGSFFGYKVKGIYNTEAEVKLLRPDGTPYKPGDYIFEDVNKDGRINNDDRQVIGSPLPGFYGGFGTSFSYKGLFFSALFTYSYGNEVYNLFNQKLNCMTDYSNQTVAVIDRWVNESQPGKGFLPRAAYGDPSGNFATSDRWVEDGSYLKFRSVSLSYDIPLNKATGFIKGINLSVNCNNLFTVTGYKGFDPEVFSSTDPLLRGVDTGMSPNPRSYILGLKISL